MLTKEGESLSKTAAINFDTRYNKCTGAGRHLNQLLNRLPASFSSSLRAVTRAIFYSNYSPSVNALHVVYV